jgi:hypothetical protein
MAPDSAREASFGRVVLWFRRDLRVDDNPALLAALRGAADVVSCRAPVDLPAAACASPAAPASPCPCLQVPVFIWAPEEEGQFQPGRCSRWWTKHSLMDLEQALAALGSRLIIRRATDSTAALLAIVKEVGAQVSRSSGILGAQADEQKQPLRRGPADDGLWCPCRPCSSTTCTTPSVSCVTMIASVSWRLRVLRTARSTGTCCTSRGRCLTATISPTRRSRTSGAGKLAPPRSKTSCCACSGLCRGPGKTSSHLIVLPLSLPPPQGARYALAAALPCGGAGSHAAGAHRATVPAHS